MNPKTKSKILFLTSVAVAVGCNQQQEAEKAPTVSSEGGMDRSVLPIKEPTYPAFTELDARNA